MWLTDAFRDAHGLQCGFCTPGFVISMVAFLTEHPDPSDEEIREGLAGKLCRCTGYQGIRRAAKMAAARSSFRRNGTAAGAVSSCWKLT